MPSVSASGEARVALLGGIGENIGLATAQRWRRAGMNLAITDLREDVLAQVRRRLADEPGSGGLLALSGDVTSDEDCQSWIDRTLEEFGRLDVAVCLIGRSSFGGVLEMSTQLFEQEIRTTLVGQFVFARLAARAMVAAGNGGRIILLGSGAAERARRGGVSHSAAKAGVVMMAKVMALELGEHGITVNVVSPGLVPRPGHVSTSDYRESVRRSLPLGRLGSGDDVAGAIDFLGGEDARWITGTVVTVDGGSSAGNAAAPGHTPTPTSVF